MLLACGQKLKRLSMSTRCFQGTIALTLTVLTTASAFGQTAVPDYTQQFRIEISSDMNSMYDEAMMYFEAGTPSYDNFDVIKPPFANASGAPLIMTESADGANLMMNSFGSVFQDCTIPLKVEAGVSGVHHLVFYDGPGYLEQTCVRLEDNQTGSVYTIAEGDTISVYLDANDPVSPPRFNLHVGRSNGAAWSDVSCFGMNDGEIAILGGSVGPWNYEWYGPGGLFIQSHMGHNGVSKLDNISAGIYRIDVTGQSSCGVLSTYVEIESPPVITATFDVEPDDCTLPGSGAIQVLPATGVAPFSYYWDHGGTNGFVDGLDAGTYGVYVFDSTGCSHYYPSVEVGTINGPEADIVVSSAQAMVNEPLHFHNEEYSTADHYWDFGDGTTSNDVTPDHAFASPGTYTVRLILDDLNCTDTSFTDVIVGANGITDIGPFSDVQVVYVGGGIDIAGPEVVLKRSTVQVIDVQGRQIVAPRELGMDRYIPLGGVSNGVYRVIFSDAAGRRAIPVSIIQ